MVRHADPDYRKDGLTERGKAEAQALSRWMKRSSEFCIDRIYTSPMGRAKETTEYVSEALGIPFHVEPWARELSEWRALGAKGPAGGGGTGAVWDVDGESVRRAMREGGRNGTCGSEVRTSWRRSVHEPSKRSELAER